jgi:hypothetical protein
MKYFEDLVLGGEWEGNRKKKAQKKLELLKRL